MIKYAFIENPDMDWIHRFGWTADCTSELVMLYTGSGIPLSIMIRVHKFGC